MKRSTIFEIVAMLLIANIMWVLSFVEKFPHPPRARTCFHSSRSSALQSSFQPQDLNLLPFPVSETLFPGQSTCVTLKEGRFFDLIDDATTNHNGLIGMVLVNDDGICMDGMPLCKIVDLDVRSGFRGKVTMSVELRAVARARLAELKQMRPTMIGTCIEFHDKLQTSIADLETSQSLADRLEDILRKSSVAAVYRRAYTDALAILTEQHHEKECQKLAAKSWGLMASLSQESIERYGQKAIASNDVHERLNIIAKAFLEEQMQSSGKMMSTITTDDQEIAGFE